MECSSSFRQTESLVTSAWYFTESERSCRGALTLVVYLQDMEFRRCSSLRGCDYRGRRVVAGNGWSNGVIKVEMRN